MPDAVVVGSGPNGLTAAIVLARAGRSVLVLEAAETVGGGLRTAERTLPGFRHDVCSAIHPLCVGSPILAEFPLEEHGLSWVESPVPLAHPLTGGAAALLERDVDATAAGLGVDARAYRRLVGPLVDGASALLTDILGPLRVPRHPVVLARFGANAILPASFVARRRFDAEPARALFAGLAAHSMLPLERPPSSAVALVLCLLGHRVGWPFPRGGAWAIAEALTAYLQELGGEIATGRRVDSLAELPDARCVLLDCSPRDVVRICGDKLPSAYRRRLERYRYGPGVFKVDFALDGAVPWAAEACATAATLHVGGTLDEIVASERSVARGEHAERPFVLVAQPSVFDPTRAPAGMHTLWAYCHVPNGSTVDMAERIERQIERFAPGFRERIVARSTIDPAAFERYNPNYVGGDINGGSQDLRQLYTRPVARLVPYELPVPGVYLCSASTPPGGGVHGMCGYHAARAALRGPLR